MWMSTWTWLQRVGLASKTNQDVAHKLEEEGYLWAKDFQHLDKEGLKDIQIKGADVDVMLAVMSNDKKRASLLQGFLCPPRPRLLREFALAYPAADEETGNEFAQACSDAQGQGLVSLAMLTEHFERHKGEPEEAVKAVAAEMTHVERVAPKPKEPPPEPTDFVAGWLKSNGLENYVRNFLGQGSFQPILTPFNPNLMRAYPDFARFTRLQHPGGPGRLSVHRRAAREVPRGESARASPQNPQPSGARHGIPEE